MASARLLKVFRESTFFRASRRCCSVRDIRCISKRNGPHKMKGLRDVVRANYGGIWADRELL
jgi:hypothetical protein